MAASCSSAISVFVRARPLTPKELQQGCAELPAFEDTEAEHSTFLNKETSNRDVFALSFAPHLPTILNGGAASLFCYGYTGSGKTHTVVGYDGEPGLYALAAASLLEELQSHQLRHHGLFLSATACELYGEEVFDLLGETSVRCNLRIDDQGQLQVVGEQSSRGLAEQETPKEALVEIAKELGFDAKTTLMPFAMLITDSPGPRTARVFSSQDLQEVTATCARHRSVGVSTEHSQSSRSHALLRMEVVHEDLVRAQERLDRARAMMPARKNALDNVMMCKYTVLWKIEHGLFPAAQMAENIEDSMDYHPQYPDQAFHDPQSGYFIDMEKGYTSDGKITLKGYESHGQLRFDDWAKVLGLNGRSLLPGIARSKIHYEGDATGQRWDSLKRKLDAEGQRMRAFLNEAKAELKLATEALESIKKSGPAALGGQLLLVDLAGADYDHRSGGSSVAKKEQKESAAINKSLLSLKECFRALAGESKTHRPKFRDSKLTRLLEDSLAPSACSKRRNKKSVSVMVVNVSPAAHLEKMTNNALRYGQLFAAEKMMFSKKYSS